MAQATADGRSHDDRLDLDSPWLAAFVGPRWQAYRDRWRLMRLKRTWRSWHWSAAFLGPIWFAFRRMHLWAVCLTLAQLVFLAAIVLATVALDGSRFLPLAIVGLLAGFALFQGLIANAVYADRAGRTIHRTLAAVEADDDRKLLLRSRGGVSWPWGAAWAMTALLVLAGTLSQGNTDPAAAKEERRLALERERHSLAADLAYLENEAALRLARSPGAAIAIGVTGAGAVIAGDDTRAQLDRFVAGGIGAIGALYCIEQQDECWSLVTDLAELANRSQRVQAEIDRITQEVGYRFEFENVCPYDMQIYAKLRDIDGQAIDFVSNAASGQSYTGLFRERPIRILDQNVLWHAKSAAGLSLTGGGQRIAFGQETLDMLTASMQADPGQAARRLVVSCE